MSSRQRKLRVVKPEPKPPIPVVARLQFPPAFYERKQAWKTETPAPRVIDFHNVAGRQIAFNLGIEPEPPRKWGWRSWLLALFLAIVGSMTLGQGLARMAWEWVTQ